MAHPFTSWNSKNYANGTRTGSDRQFEQSTIASGITMSVSAQKVNANLSVIAIRFNYILAA